MLERHGKDSTWFDTVTKEDFNAQKTIKAAKLQHYQSAL